MRTTTPTECSSPAHRGGACNHPTHAGHVYDRHMFANVLEHAGHVTPDELRTWADDSEKRENYWNATAYRAAAAYIEAGDMAR